MTPARERFCTEYIVDLNGAAAYRRAYPAVKSDHAARVNASKLLARDDVTARIGELKKKALERSAVTADRVLRELAFVAFQRAGDIYRADGSLKNPDEWDEATAATVSGIETTEEHLGAEEQEPQGHGGTLKRNRGTGPVVRTHKVKRWDKVKALELYMRHFGLLTEDAPHPDRPKFDISRLTDVQKLQLLTFLRAIRGG